MSELVCISPVVDSVEGYRNSCSGYYVSTKIFVRKQSGQQYEHILWTKTRTYILPQTIKPKAHLELTTNIITNVHENQNFNFSPSFFFKFNFFP